MTHNGQSPKRSLKLKATNWKDIAELVGIAAIVASLIFVGLQMKQSQEIAVAETYQQEIAAAYASGELASLNAEAVERANEGAQLTDAERFALEEYVRTKWLHAYFSRSHQRFLGRNTGGPIANTSFFFCENPGLMRIWKEQIKRMSRDSGPTSRLTEFTVEIQRSIEDRCGE